MIEIFDVQCIFCSVGGLVDDGVGERVVRDIEICWADVDVGGICSEEVKAVVSGIVLVGATQADNDETDEGGDGKGHGREDTRKTACFPHDGDRLRFKRRWLMDDR